MNSLPESLRLRLSPEELASLLEKESNPDNESKVDEPVV